MNNRERDVLCVLPQGRPCISNGHPLQTAAVSLSIRASAVELQERAIVEKKRLTISAVIPALLLSSLFAFAQDKQSTSGTEPACHSGENTSRRSWKPAKGSSESRRQLVPQIACSDEEELKPLPQKGTSKQDGG